MCIKDAPSLGKGMVLHTISSIQVGIRLQIHSKEKSVFPEHSIPRKLDGNCDALPRKLHFNFRRELAGHTTSDQFNDSSHSGVL